MTVPTQQQDYKVTTAARGSKKFFNDYALKDWNFENYYNVTRSDSNKDKKFKAIATTFKNDLNWIAQMNNVPAVVIEYVKSLIAEKSPTKADMKARETENAVKKRKLTYSQKFIVRGSGSINVGNVINGDHNVVQDTGKRKIEDGVETAESKDAEVNDSANVDANTGNHKDPLADAEIANLNPNATAALSLWKRWYNFFQNSKADFHPYSLAAHNIVRCGAGISSNPFLDQELFNEQLNSHFTSTYVIPRICTDFIDVVMDKESVTLYRKALNCIPEPTNEESKVEDEQNLQFVQDILRGILKSYTTSQNIKDGESTFNALFVYPFLESVATTIKVHNCGADFKVGESTLESMKQQLKDLKLQVDERCQYKADGIIKLYNMKELEILLLETSGSFMNKDMVKICFDHHKGSFGSLALLKVIADEFYYASLETFKKLKVFFIHAAGENLHVWSVSYCDDEVFELWRVEVLTIKPLFEDRLGYIPNAVQFFWTLRCLLTETVNTISLLKKEHENGLRMYRYTSCPHPTLNMVVNPIILKLTQEEDSTGMAEMGPFYV